MTVSSPDMFDLKKRHSLVLKVGSETEFRRVALRRRSRGAVEDHPSETGEPINEFNQL